MKYNLQKITLVLAVCTITLIHAGNTPWYMSDIKNMNRHYYQQNCKKISNVQSIRTIGLIAYNLITHDKNNPHKQLQEIKEQLQSFETKLLKKEDTILLAIKQKFSIADEQWNSWMVTIANLKKTYKQALQQAWPSVTHNLPEDLKRHLFDIMKNNNINPCSINLECGSPDNKNIVAEAATHISFFTDPLEFTNTYIPHTITFSPKGLNCSDREKKATCAHEIEHIIRQHVMVQFILTQCLVHYKNLTPDEITNSNEFQQLIRNHEQQADILSSIKDPDIAACMAEKRALYFYPNYMYEKHYYHLSTIHMLWQLYAWVEFFHHGGIEKAKKEFTSKIDNYVSSFNDYYKKIVKGKNYV